METEALIETVGAIALAPHFLTYATDVVAWTLAKRTKDEKTIEDIIKEESAKLSIPGPIPVIQRKIPGYGARAVRMGFNTKTDRLAGMSEIGGEVVPLNAIEWGEKLGLSRHTIRHELYHITKHLGNKCQNPILRKIQHFGYHEPAAIIYSITGIKI